MAQNPEPITFEEQVKVTYNGQPITATVTLEYRPTKRGKFKVTLPLLIVLFREFPDLSRSLIDEGQLFRLDNTLRQALSRLIDEMRAHLYPDD